MALIELFILAFAMAIDAMIVSICYGIVVCANRFKNSMLLALSFGFFQFIMPILGWYFTGFVYEILNKYSKWIVFTIFMVLGIKFLKESFEKNEKKEITCISISCIFFLAFATSIDAFGAGVSLKFLNAPLIVSASLIGIITFILSFIGFWLSGLFKKMPKQIVEILGSIMLIYLAFKALI